MACHQMWLHFDNKKNPILTNEFNGFINFFPRLNEGLHCSQTELRHVIFMVRHPNAFPGIRKHQTRQRTIILAS